MALDVVLFFLWLGSSSFRRGMGRCSFDCLFCRREKKRAVGLILKNATHSYESWVGGSFSNASGADSIPT